MTSQTVAATPGQPAFSELFMPKLVTVLREGYRADDLKADVIAGLTVAIVALPLSMAIAIASGATPDKGLYASIFGGFLVSALGGSRFQIGGPAGAFIILVAATIQQHGFDGALLATVMAGVMLMAIGFLRLGTYIKFIPYPVTVGFTAGIAVIIFASQIRDLLGLTLTEKEPGELLHKLEVLGKALPTANWSAIAIAAASIAIIMGLKRYRPMWPGMLIAVLVTSVAAALLHLPVETIGTRFGGIPSSLPLPSLPPFNVDKMIAVLPSAIAFTLLGAIESLLSAVVADGMTGRRHRSNCELVAQGAANIVTPLFGGLVVTGTIARTATNVRAGSHGPFSGIFHSIFLLLFILVAAPLASYIPLAALAGVLATVAWNMAEKHEFALLLRSSKGDALVLLTTFLLTIFRDLTEGIVVGFALGAILFISRMADTAGVETHGQLVPQDVADHEGGRTERYDPAMATDPDIAVYRIKGAFFFGAASTIGAVLDGVGEKHRAVIVDLEAVPLLDSTGANTIAGIARKAKRHNVQFFVTGASMSLRHVLLTGGVREPQVLYRRTIDEALAEARATPTKKP